MFPIILNNNPRILVVGDGPVTERRMKLLNDGDIDFIHVKQVPSKDILSDIDICFVADFDYGESQKIYNLLHQYCLVNTEDKKEFCDFHVPSIVRRGDMLLTSSTGGNSPAMARIVREKLESIFLPKWGDLLDQIAQKRLEWRAEGKDFEEIYQLTKEEIDNAT